MKLYVVTFKDGSTMEEYGDSVRDVMEFLARSYSHKGKPVSVNLKGE